MPRRDREWERFRVVRQLGAGAFGRTLLVIDTARHDREVVIKVPHDKKTEASLINDLINVHALTANLERVSHPNIVRCLGFDVFEGFYVMILEYVKGHDLRDVLGPIHLVRPPLELDLALGILKDVCAGLCSAHSLKLIHRDIKPDNVIIREEDGVAKILDFGLSTLVQSSSVGTGTVAGTFPYMAPEALAGKASFQSDLWSLAVTLYEMVTGRVPFWDENPWKLKLLIDTADPVPPSRFNPRVDARLEAFILRGLEKSQKRRFRTAREMAEALVPILGPMPEVVETHTAEAPSPAPAERFAPPVAAAEPDSGLDREIATIRKTFLDGSEGEAVGKATALLAEQQRDPRAYMLLGELFNRQQQYARTEEVVRRGIEACPGHAGLHFYLAPALWNQGGKKRRDAIATMERALELGLGPGQAQQARNLLRTWRATGGGA